MKMPDNGTELYLPVVVDNILPPDKRGNMIRVITKDEGTAFYISEKEFKSCKTTFAENSIPIVK